MRKSIWNAIERKLDDYSLRKKFYIFYVLCVMLPLIVTDAVVLSIVNNAEKESSRHEMSSIASAPDQGFRPAGGTERNGSNMIDQWKDLPYGYRIFRQLCFLLSYRISGKNASLRKN